MDSEAINDALDDSLEYSDFDDDFLDPDYVLSENLNDNRNNSILKGIFPLISDSEEDVENNSLLVVENDIEVNDSLEI